MEPLLQISHLTKIFSDGKEDEYKAVDDVSFELFPGEKLAIIGESGSGKTTVVNMITRLLDSTDGKILLDGEDTDFEEAMELCQLKPPYEVMTLSVMADRQKLELPTEKILYIDYQNRMTRIHTAERVIPVSGGFQEVTAALQKDKRFLPCYRGILINMDYISQVDSQNFRLINGEELPIALRNGKQLRETYRQYVFSGMGGIV